MGEGNEILEGWGWKEDEDMRWKIGWAGDFCRYGGGIVFGWQGE